MYDARHCAPRAPTTACRCSSTRPPGSSARRAFTGRRSATSSGRCPCCPGRSTTTSPPRTSCSPPSTRRACAGSRSACRPRSTRRTDPWERLEAACVAHLEALLEESDYAQVVIRVQPADVPSVAARLVALRDGYERLFVDLVAELPLAPRRRPAQPAPDAARRAQLVADLVPAGPRRARARSPAVSLRLLRAPDRQGVDRWTSAPRCSSPRSASTATTAAAGSSPRICATPAWK